MKTRLLTVLMCAVLLLQITTKVQAQAKSIVLGNQNPEAKWYNPFYPQVLDSVDVMDNSGTHKYGIAKVEYDAKQRITKIEDQYYGDKVECIYEDRDNETLITDKTFYRDGNEWKESSSRNIYAYDNNGFQTMEAYSYYNDETKTWEMYRKEEYSKQGDVFTQINYELDGETGKLTKDRKYEDSYNESGKTTMSAYYYWSEEYNDWEGDSKTEYEYDEEGRKVLDISYDWNSATGKWKISYKAEYVYDRRGDQVEYMVYGWLQSYWNPRHGTKREYVYDNNGRKQSYKQYNWRVSKWEYDYSHLYEYTYDDKGNAISRIETSEDGENRYKEEYAYDDKGNQTMFAEYTWDVNEWRGYEKNECAYDNKGNIVLNIEYAWDLETKIWILKRKGECAYDEHGNKTILVDLYADYQGVSWRSGSKEVFVFDANNKRIERRVYSWDEDIQAWDDDDDYYTKYNSYGNVSEKRDSYTYVYHYRGDGTGINNSIKANQNIYISGNTLYICTPISETITVYSVTGELLYTFAKPAGEASFTLNNTKHQMLIVRTESGEIKKILN
ncbi:uncharacterized protein YkuJ [Dysgonomonadaceae bacterium PH5-43]|nr:uncharacterized protein YkuJ [Dysgonomonadaceae bacterium PH5-43]